MLPILLFGVLLKTSLSSPVANIWLTPLGSVAPLRQYHMQDGSGAYQYAFTGPHHAKAESSLNGITQGGYSYIDANGVLQTVAYTADDENGFRVSASNLPQPAKNELQDSSDVASPKRNHLDEPQRSQPGDQPDWQDHNVLSYKILPPVLGYAQLREDGKAKHQHLASQAQEGTKNPFLLSRAEASRIEVPKPDPALSRVSPSRQSPPIQSAGSSESTGNEGRRPDGFQPGKLLALPDVHPLPVPAPYVLPVLPYRLLHSSLRHTQDSLGQYDYSYSGDSSAKTESRSLDGTTRGAYSYIDPNGVLQQVHYIADHNGFRVLATNLPEA